jgi:chromosome partitioning protein
MLNVVTLDDISARAERVQTVLDTVKSVILAPKEVKRSPLFGTAELFQVCDMTKHQMRGVIDKGDLPGGELVGARREWSLADFRVWARTFRPSMMRPESADAFVLTIANFKGGVSKTTTSVSLAQGLSLRGHKVLLIDLDAQGSASTLCGLAPNADSTREKTALPLFMGDVETIDDSIQSTYWDGMDIVGANPQLYGAEFVLPSRQKNDPGFEFWRVLDFGLDAARKNYDVILIDTPPSLSYTTINALMAADGVVMPCPPSALDFASSAQFWGLLNDVSSTLYSQTEHKKQFEFFNVLRTRVGSKTTSISVVRDWMNAAYGDIMLSAEVPESAATQNAAAEMSTIYDLPKGSMSSRTLQRAKDAYDDCVQEIEAKIVSSWNK